MKDLITTVASVLILMMFMTQFVANEKTYLRLFAANSIISAFESSWQSAGDITAQDISSLNKELSERLKGKVVIDSLDRSESGNGIYALKMKVYDVIGPYKLLSPYNGENAALRIRNIRIDRSEEEKADEEPDNNPGTGDSILNDDGLGIQNNE